MGPNQLSILFVVAAVGMYVLEFCWKREYLGGALGAVLFTCACGCFYSGQNRIATTLAVSLGLILGVATGTLCWVAKRARLNKTSDL